MDWAAFAAAGLPYLLRIWGPFCEHRAAGGRGTETSRWVSGSASILLGWGMDCWAEMSEEAPGLRGAGLQWLWWSSVRTVAFYLGSVNLISVSLTQWLPHTWNVSDSGSERWAGPDRVCWWDWSFRASVLRAHWGSASTDTRLCMHGGFWGG